MAAKELPILTCYMCGEPINILDAINDEDMGNDFCDNCYQHLGVMLQSVKRRVDDEVYEDENFDVFITREDVLTQIESFI
jgi:hypothetical protein